VRLQIEVSVERDWRGGASWGSTRLDWRELKGGGTGTSTGDPIPYALALAIQCIVTMPHTQRSGSGPVCMALAVQCHTRREAAVVRCAWPPLLGGPGGDTTADHGTKKPVERSFK
jgi:hypothetical protein